MSDEPLSEEELRDMEGRAKVPGVQRSTLERLLAEVRRLRAERGDAVRRENEACEKACWEDISHILDPGQCGCLECVGRLSAAENIRKRRA